MKEHNSGEKLTLMMFRVTPVILLWKNRFVADLEKHLDCQTGAAAGERGLCSPHHRTPWGRKSTLGRECSTRQGAVGGDTGAPARQKRAWPMLTNTSMSCKPPKWSFGRPHKRYRPSGRGSSRAWISWSWSSPSTLQDLHTTGDRIHHSGKFQAISLCLLFFRLFMKDSLVTCINDFLFFFWYLLVINKNNPIDFDFLKLLKLFL